MKKPTRKAKPLKHAEVVVCPKCMAKGLLVMQIDPALADVNGREHRSAFIAAELAAMRRDAKATLCPACRPVTK